MGRTTRYAIALVALLVGPSAFLATGQFASVPTVKVQTASVAIASPAPHRDSRWDAADPTTTTAAPPVTVKARVAPPAVAYIAHGAAAGGAPPPSAGKWCKDNAADTARVEQWRQNVAVFAWPVDTMLHIMCRESSGFVGAVNPSSGACGLMQLNPCPGGWAFDGDANLTYAYQQKYLPACARGDCLGPWGF